MGERVTRGCYNWCSSNACACVHAGLVRIGLIGPGYIWLTPDFRHTCIHIALLFLSLVLTLPLLHEVRFHTDFKLGYLV